MASFNYSQRLKRRVIRDSTLERFKWDLYKFDSQYVEPFSHVALGGLSQSYVPRVEHRPQRHINLTFVGMKDFPENRATDNPTNFRTLYNFYLRHGTYKSFIFEHPVYGDLIVRFGKTLVVPTRVKDGLGTVDSFNILLIEKITTSYCISENEDLDGDFPIPVEYYDAEIETQEDTLVAPLGSNYEMVFIRAKKPMRTIKLSIFGLKYLWYDEDTLNVSACSGINLGLFELFYLKHRLDKPFTFYYFDEEITVRFAEPLKIPQVDSKTGIISQIDINLIETPNEEITKEVINGSSELVDFNYEIIPEGVLLTSVPFVNIQADYRDNFGLQIRTDGNELMVKSEPYSTITVEY